MATHDYVLDNATGANFRADINLALAAIVSNNSSATEPSTKYAYQWWADTNDGVLKIRNSANDGWVTLLQLDGTLTLEDGSNSAPALGFRDDLNTGIFSSAADTLDVTCGGTTRGSFSASGLAVTGSVTATTFVGNVDAVDGDFDGTLEADAITVAGTALSTVIAGTTLTQAAQTNITSLGTLTGLTVGGDVTFDGATTGRDIVFDRSDNALEFADNAKAKFGSSEELEIYYDGTNPIFYAGTKTVRVVADNIHFEAGDFGDEFIRCNHDASVDLYYDNSKKFETTSSGINVTGQADVDSINCTGELDLTGHLDLNSDSSRIKLGAGDDFQLYHDGSNNYIFTNNGDIIVQTDGDDIQLLASDDVIIKVQGGLETAINCIGDGAVELYHNNSKKLETNSSGVNVIGSLTVDGSAISGGGGKILQVVQQTKTDTATHSVNINQGAANFSLIMSKSITPANSSNKILVQFSISGNVEANGAHVDFVLRKTVGSTVTHPILGDSASGYTSITTGFRSGGGNQHNVGQCIYQFLDDAGTTSAITYGVAVATEGATTYRVNASGGDLSSQSWSSRQASTIVLMEVSA